MIDARDIPRVNEARKLEMLEAFAEGYFQAVEALKGEGAEERGVEPEADPNQPGLFDYPKGSF